MLSPVPSNIGIVILGGGLLPSGDLPPHTNLRVIEAVKLYQDLLSHSKQENIFIIPLSGGTPHKPNPLDSKGFPIWESTAATKKLLSYGIPADRIMEESFSLDTLGNVCYM